MTREHFITIVLEASLLKEAECNSSAFTYENIVGEPNLPIDVL